MTLQNISLEEVKRIAALAALRLKEQEAGQMAKHLANILKNFRSLQEVDTSSVGIDDVSSIPHIELREDLPSPSMESRDVLKNAPSTSNEFIKIRRVF